MKLVGSWPIERLSTSTRRIYTLFVFAFFLIPASLFPAIYLFSVEEVDVIKVTQNGFLFAELMLVPIKLTSLIIHHDQLKRATAFWNNLQLNAHVHRKNQIIMETTAATERQFKAYVILILITCIGFSAKPLQNTEIKSLPIETWWPYDPFRNNFTYVLTYVNLSVGKF